MKSLWIVVLFVEHKFLWYMSAISWQRFLSDLYNMPCGETEQQIWTGQIANTEIHIWWRHQMEHFPRYLYFVRGNPRGGRRWISPSQRPVTRSFEVFLDLLLNKQLGKQSIRRWFETPSCSLWRHCKDTFLSLFQFGYKRLVAYNNLIQMWAHNEISYSCCTQLSIMPMLAVYDREVRTCHYIRNNQTINTNLHRHQYFGQ